MGIHRAAATLTSRSLSSSLAVLGLIAWAPGLQEDGPKWLVLLFLCLFGKGFDYRLCLFVLWACLSYLWAPDYPTQLMGVFIFAALFTIDVEDWVFPAGMVAACLLALFMADGGLGNPNFLAAFIAVCIPWCFRKGRYWTLIPALFTLLLTDSKTAWFAFWIAGTIWLWKQPWRDARWLAAILFMVPINLAIFGVIDVWPSIHQRAEIWINTIFMWLDHPFFGVGVNGFDYFYPLYGSDHLVLFPKWGYTQEIQKFVGAAHNEYWQLLAQLGIVGFGLAIYFLKGLNWKGPAAWSVLIGGILALIGFPLQNPATLAVIALCLGKLAPERATGKPLRGCRWGPNGEIIARLPYVVISLVLIGFMTQQLRAEWAFQGTLAYFKTDPVEAIQANIRAYEIAPWDFRFRYQLYPMLAKASTQKNVNIPEATWKRAWEISTSASPYSRYLKELRRAQHER